MSERKGPTGKSVAFFAALGICFGILTGVIFGWQYAIVGLGVGVGPLLGGYFGNKKAREVDKYREELIRGKTENGTRVTTPPRCDSRMRWDIQHPIEAGERRSISGI